MNDMHILHYMMHCMEQGIAAYRNNIGRCAASAWDSVMPCKAYNGFSYVMGFTLFAHGYLSDARNLMLND